MKKSIKIIAGIVAFALIGGILIFANAFVGNPISKLIINNKAKQYVAANYKDMDLVIEKPSYNFKTGSYYVSVKSNSSIDTHFYIDYSAFGQFGYDSYDDDVLGRQNTYYRIEDEYRKKFDNIMDNSSLKDKLDISYATIKTSEKDSYQEQFIENYGIEIKDLELDKEYDVNEIGKDSGTIVLYINEDEVSIDKVVEELLEIKEILDKEGFKFYTIDFCLREFIRNDEEKKIGDEIRIEQFLYEDIYEKDLKSRVESNVEKTNKIYEELDKEKNI